MRIDWDGKQTEQAALAPKEHGSGEFAPDTSYIFLNGFEGNGSHAFFMFSEAEAMYFLNAGPRKFTTPMRIDTKWVNQCNYNY